MQSWKALLVVAGMLIGPIVGPTAALAETPPDVQAIVDAAYAEWDSALGIRQQCSAGVTIIFEELDGRRGEYRTGSAEVVIDPTDSTNGLGAIVVHELAHHTFLACGVFADGDFTEAFYASQGLPEGRDWFDYAAGWAATPAEHFAEAVAVTVHGSGEGGVPVGTETIGLVSKWLAGAPTTPPAPSYDPVPYSSETGLPGGSGIVVSDGPPTIVSDPAPTVESQALYRTTVELAVNASASVLSLTHRFLGPKPM